MTNRTQTASEYVQLLFQKGRELHLRASSVANQIAAGEDTTFAVAMLRESQSAVDFWTDELVKLAEAEASRG